MRAGIIRMPIRAWHRPNLPILFQGEPRGVQGSGPERSLEYQGAAAETAYDAVPGQEPVRQGRSARRIFGESAASRLEQAVAQTPVGPGIPFGEPVREHRVSASARGERAFLGGRVDAQG